MIQEEQHQLAASFLIQYTISEVIDVLGYGKFQLQLSIAVGMAFLTDAMEMMILSVLSPALECSNWKVTKTQLASLTTAVFVAMTLTSPIWGLISDTYGRRKSLIISSTLLFIFGLGTAFSPTYTWLLIFRFLCGCFISCMPQCITLFLEYVPSRTRGKSNVGLALVWSLGATLTILVAWGCMRTWAANGWRVMVVFCVSPILIFLSLSNWVPESILFLAEKGKIKEANDILKVIAQKHGKEDILNSTNILFTESDATNEDSKDEQHIAQEDVKHDPTSCYVIHFIKKIWSQLFILFEPGRKKLTCFLWIISVLSGFNYYGVVLFATGLMTKGGDQLTNNTANATTANESVECRVDYFKLIWTSLAEFPITFISLWMMDFMGRKKTFALNSLIFTISLLLIIIGGAYPDSAGNFRDPLIIGLLFLARGSGVAYTWCLFIYAPEVYPTEVRSVAFGFASTFIRIGGMITPFVAQVLMSQSLTAALGVYIAMGIVATIFPLYLPIETMGSDLSRQPSTLPSERRKLLPPTN